MTALIMFLPHIPISASQHLPALFNIYSRLLFWDRERRVVEPQRDQNNDEKSERSTNIGKPWEKLPYLLESEDENVPELLHYFTFLYGLYPINFMSYIRKPQRYLRHAKFSGADDLEIEPTEIRQRSEPFRQVHLLHPNFFHLTIESELTDNERWRRSEAADVVAECMALYVPSEDGHEHARRRPEPSKKADLNSDVPDQPLLEREMATPYQSRHNSWRNTTSTAVPSPEGFRQTAIQRKLSQTSQSMPSNADSPSLRPSNHHDSPIIPPQTAATQTNNQLVDLLNAQKSTRGSLYQALTNDSVASLALSNTIHDSASVDAYLLSLSRDVVPRSPSLRPSTTVPAEASLKVAYLNREIQLLKNDLNFERYLKQQHLSHIGQLRRKQIREARVEAETQNLINSNRGLKSKLEEAKRLNAQMKKETERSKTHSRKWESDLTAKLRLLRQEQKKWTLERQQLSKDLDVALENVKCLRQIVVTSERNELAAQQKMASVESSLDELDRLRAEVEKLTARLRTYESSERSAFKAKENEVKALSQVERLEMEIRARDYELTKIKAAFEQESYAVRPLQSMDDQDRAGDKSGSSREAALTHEVIDSALASSRSRIIDLKKAHNNLLQRYNTLQGAYMDLCEQLQHAQSTDEPPLGSISAHGSMSPSLTPRTYPRRKHSSSDPERFEYMSSPPTGPLPPIPAKPGRLDTTNPSNSATSAGGRSPTSGTGQPHFFQAPKPFKPPGTSGTGSSSGNSEQDTPGQPKVKPQSDPRIYGRGKSSSYFRV
jgi:solute carrier family 25 protein 16